MATVPVWPPMGDPVTIWVFPVLGSGGSFVPAVPVQTMDFSTLSADDARSAILCFADDFSWETVAREMINRMSVDDARDFAEHFHTNFVEG